MSRSRARLAADWFAKLRQNAVTQEVEHMDVMAAEAEALEAKADAADAADAAAASASTASPTLTLTGDATGSATLANLGNATLSVTVADDSHNHVWGNIDGASVNSWGGLRNSTSSGYIDFGPANTGWAHIYTDRPNFYFNKNLYVNGTKLTGSTSTSAGAVGTYALVGRYSGTPHDVGHTIAGSSLFSWECYNSSNRSSGAIFSVTAHSERHGFAGTWRWVSSGQITSYRSRLGLAVRIS